MEMHNLPRLSISTPLMNVMYAAVMDSTKRLARDFHEVENLQVSKKGPGDFVTISDQKIEERLKNNLKKARPNFGFITEESKDIQGADNDSFWIIDPIDGTNNFIHGIPHFCVTIAAMNAGEIIAGIVYDPIKSEMFYAQKGYGAFVNNSRIRVSSRNNISDALLATGSFSAKCKDNEHVERVARISKLSASIRQFGSTALDLAYVAAGRFDGYFNNNLKLWDIAAGIILIKEAGGIIKSYDNDDKIIDKASIVASNHDLHPIRAKAI